MARRASQAESMIGAAQAAQIATPPAEVLGAPHAAAAVLGAVVMLMVDGEGIPEIHGALPCMPAASAGAGAATSEEAKDGGACAPLGGGIALALAIADEAVLVESAGRAGAGGPPGASRAERPGIDERETERGAHGGDHGLSRRRAGPPSGTWVRYWPQRRQRTRWLPCGSVPYWISSVRGGCAQSRPAPADRDWPMVRRRPTLTPARP
jgi:hypothetical protein